MDKVTVIIPTYKKSDSICRAIDSVLKQTYSNIEIIVVDDNDEGSCYRIENEKKLSKYKDIIYLKHKKNMNGAVARNSGIKVATGKYITFLDDDDFYLPNRIEKLVDILKKHKEYDAIYSSTAILKEGKIKNIVPAVSEKDLLIKLLKQNSFFGTGSNMFFTREAINKVGLFDESFERHQDIEYMIRFLEIGKIKAINEILVVKCVNNENLPNYEKILQIKQRFFKKFNEQIKNTGEENEIKYLNYYSLLNTFMYNKEAYKKIYKEMIKYKKIDIKILMVLFYRKYIKKFFVFQILTKLKNEIKINRYLNLETKKYILNYYSKYI